jgi:membrane protein DedA with SNARE-associated domain
MRVNMSWRLIAGIVAVLLVLAGLGLLLMSLTDNAMGLLKDPSSDLAAYAVVFILVYGDAVTAVLPGETTLNVASTLASQGELELSLIIIAGALGAWLGDSTLYWIARSIPALREKAREARQDERLKQPLELIGRHDRLLVVFCRFLPFVRWAVTAGMGALPMPYPKYALWSAIGDTAWAAYTCLVAYTIGTALDEFPVASIIISCVSSGVVVGAVLVVERRRRRSTSNDGAAVTGGSG